MSNLRIGSRGSEVQKLQRILNQKKAAFPLLGEDGIFGAKTHQAVRNYQQRNGLSVDGIVGPNTRRHLGMDSNSPTPAPTPVQPVNQGKSISLKTAESYKGQVLGPHPYKGECAAGVQVIFADAGKPLGLTSTWKPGAKVRGNKIPAGTAIASFKDGKYWKHTAILIRETSSGLEVWDQWAGQPWHKRTLYFRNDNDGSNNGNLFYVIN